MARAVHPDRLYCHDWIVNPVLSINNIISQTISAQARQRSIESYNAGYLRRGISVTCRRLNVRRWVLVGGVKLVTHEAFMHFNSYYSALIYYYAGWD